MKKINILFVCLGNICRSPMAEYIMRDKVSKAGIQQWIHIASAGTSGENDGCGVHCGTAEILERLHIQYDDFISRKVCLSDWDTFDYIIAMDQHNLQDLHRLFGRNPHKLFIITDLCPNLGYDHIPDPWYSGKFNQTYKLLNQCCEVLLVKLLNENGLKNLPHF